jgi:DNA (cytosine-5)-methyltransferase 1
MADGGRVVGLFAGIGGLEEGLRRSGFHASFLCESWEPAQRVLRARFRDVPLHGDITTLKAIPKSDVVVAGFPCTDLSQAGRTAGIDGSQSGLVRTALELVRRNAPADWLVLENVRNMLTLHSGRAMEVLTATLEDAGFRWAYRVIDSRFSGVPQRRQRVILVASKRHDPREVLFADNAQERPEDSLRDDSWGFYWTEGLRGLGWCRDGVPTLKGGSTIGIPSPPGVWRTGADSPTLVMPSVTAGERLQGFRSGWTKPAVATGAARGEGVRWKLIGNAVTVPAAAWLGSRLREPGSVSGTAQRKLAPQDGWPLAAYGARGTRWRVDVSMWPCRNPYLHLGALLDRYGSKPISVRGAQGFLSRLERSSLRLFPREFKEAVAAHVAGAVAA